MVKLNLKEIKTLKTRLDAENASVIDEFLTACNQAKNFDELEDYVDLLLGVADEISEEDQQIIYNVIDDIQK